MSTSAELMRELRARQRAAQQRAHPSREHVYGMSAVSAKLLGLESIGWLADTERKRAAYYRGILARGSRLPAEWWLSRMHLTIAALVTAVEEASLDGRHTPFTSKSSLSSMKWRQVAPILNGHNVTH